MPCQTDSPITLASRVLAFGQGGSPAHKAAEILLAVRPPFPVDLIVRTPEKLKERLAMGDTFLRDIIENGKVLYEANDH